MRRWPRSIEKFQPINSAMSFALIESAFLPVGLPKYMKRHIIVHRIFHFKITIHCFVPLSLFLLSGIPFLVPLSLELFYLFTNYLSRRSESLIIDILPSTQLLLYFNPDSLRGFLRQWRRSSTPGSGQVRSDPCWLWKTSRPVHLWLLGPLFAWYNPSLQYLFRWTLVCMWRIHFE